MTTNPHPHPKTPRHLTYEDEEDANLGYSNFKGEAQDHEYERMVPSTKGGRLRTLEYFRNSGKYAGRVSHHSREQEDKQQQEQHGQIDEEEQQEQANQVDGIKQTLANIKNTRKQRSNLLSEDLKAIDRQDRQNMIRMKQQQEKEGNPQALRNQLYELNKLTEIRYYSQKNLQGLKKYPTNNIPASQQLHSLHKQAEKTCLTTLQKLVQNFQHLATNYFQTQHKITNCISILQDNTPSLHTNRLNVQKLYETFQQQTQQLSQKLQQQLINWSQRTTLLRNSVGKTQFGSLLMQTPVGQAKKVIEDWEKVSRKCQQKRSPFRVLFQPEGNLREMTDRNIYDDLDLLQEVQRNYEQELEKDDKDFLMKDTLKYLENKSKTKIVKDVDRKASKNRKIRFNVHPKLLNFMPCQNDNAIEARDEIVRNLFNRGTQLDSAADYIDI